MGDILLLWVEPNPVLSFELVRERARAFSCDFVVWRNQLRPVRDLGLAVETYPPIDAYWLLRRGRPFGAEDL
jgi:hypothetical protein